ncbi:MAG: hypothetical protein ACKO9I_03285 [Sphaerospermopsis kisseleviana]|jgi:hypothetical protein|uniref:Uncharacterized protein n=3 Tax=Sphaerospermopsis TaxID=752201 RepID=A0A480A574_9CYAN|nr:MULTISPECIES: hypothetical protein [Sphaerospermopsis]MEB3150815.1 hypothetical protein [Sphaerospermopsis sp.]BAZ83481.1 hypothetical protein NIES73_47700 [Sphaerospermopsis kisseleviana NIES-73]MBC5797138.1 hypothetical protein [Sphaerospermopsis sp. LEGE 00249]MBD2131481.1 hypothetical protein [Sphaerospermopsis sp. FACHB-1094]MBD2147148.1 hypothetical protein [Sphaerospermopsis sp. FACHB-1194]
MKLIKKSEKLLLDKIKSMELEEENILTEITNEPEPLVEERRVIDIENQVPDYIPVRDNPIVHSVGNTGWQVSEIWKEIRLDNFCNT